VNETAARPLSIVMATTSYPRWEGDHAGHFVASLASAIAEVGHAVTVVAPHAPSAEEAEEAGGVRVRRVRYLPDSWERLAYGDGIVPNLKRDPLAWVGVPALRRAFARAVRLEARETAADVVHAHWAPTAWLARVGRGALFGLPAVLTLHGSDVELARRSRMFGRILTRALEPADALIVVSDEQARYLRESGEWDGPLDVIPSGVPVELLERERPGRDPHADSATGRFTLVYVGRLIENKGVLDLIDAFGELDARRPGEARLLLVGSGPLESRMRERVVARGLGSRVEFLGRLPHERTVDEIASADALVLPSYAEGSPLVITEALALGTPVIGTRVGAVPELVGEDGGVLVAAGDIGGLADALEVWVTDCVTAREAGEAARARIARTHAWPVIARRTLQAYESAIQQAAGGAARPSPSGQVD